MKQIQEIKLGLVTLLNYEPDAFEEEIDEIFNCISRHRPYDVAPNLSTNHLIDLLEGLGHSILCENNSLNRINTSHIEKLRQLTDSSGEINENSESLIRIEIRRILLGR